MKIQKEARSTKHDGSENLQTGIARNTLHCDDTIVIGTRCDEI